jgi:hypothetical protein
MEKMHGMFSFTHSRRENALKGLHIVAQGKACRRPGLAQKNNGSIEPCTQPTEALDRDRNSSRAPNRPREITFQK